MRTEIRKRSIGALGVIAVLLGTVGGGTLAVAPASAASSCSTLSWVGTDENDVVGTCRVDPGKKITVKISCQSLPGYQAFTKTKTVGTQSFVWNTGCHSPFYSKGVLSYKVS